MFAQASSALLMMALSLAARAEDDVPMPPLRTPDKDVAPRRAGPSEPLQYFPPPVDPAQVPSPASSAPRESLPVSDRWRIMQSLGLKSPWFDPYNQNLLKGDLPVYKDWFVNLGVVSDALLEARRLPTPVGPQTTDRPGSVDVFGRARQSTLVETLIVSLAAIKGNTTFKPPDYEFRLVPVFNVNRSQVDEIRALRVDPREGATRNDNHVTLQEAFADVHLRNVSSRYDFDSIRVGIQPFISDFRGFLFNDLPLGVRVFGTRDNNQWQYNLGIFRRLEKDTNSGLNDIRARPRRDDVFVANAYRQDWPMLGFTSQATAVLNVNREDNRQFYDSNGFLVRPAVQGDGRGHNYTVGYLGYSGDGHLGSLNLTTSLYLALGRDDRHPISQRSQRIRAGFAAAELSKDFSWVRVRLNALLASADRDPFDDVATGFDAILE
ncbi:MAG: hypothetical protein ABI669_12350, partial [Usitatibacter sp.]